MYIFNNSRTTYSLLGEVVIETATVHCYEILCCDESDFSIVLQWADLWAKFYAGIILTKTLMQVASNRPIWKSLGEAHVLQWTSCG